MIAVDRPFFLPFSVYLYIKCDAAALKRAKYVRERFIVFAGVIDYSRYRQISTQNGDVIEAHDSYVAGYLLQKLQLSIQVMKKRRRKICALHSVTR